ncbi:MAG: HAMP domain-containing protein, partial [Candidatus Zixiibacteriota bacterium]
MNLLNILKTTNLRTKFVLPISLLLIATIISISSYLIKKQSEGIRKELETSGETMIRMLSMNVESGVLFESKYELDDALKILSNFDDVKYAAITNSKGIILAEIGNWNYKNVSIINKINRENELGQKYCSDFYVKTNDGNEYIELNYSVLSRIEKLDRENLGLTGGLDNTITTEYEMEQIGSVKLILSLVKLNEAIDEAQAAAIFLMIIVFMLSLLVLTFLIRFITQPIKKLVEATDKISRGDLSQRVDIKQQDEIGHLAKTFNKMIESLKQSRDEIEEYNKTLEEKIIERTLKLEEAQAQLIQTEKLGAIGQLAAGVAHELNNPLGGILGYAQFTLEKMRKTEPDRISTKEMNNFVRYISDIETQARRCKNIVQSLLRFSRSSRTTEFINVDVNQVINETLTFVEHQLNMNQIILVVELAEKLPIIQGNSGQLQQVFTNLIINAMHESPANS